MAAFDQIRAQVQTAAVPSIVAVVAALVAVSVSTPPDVPTPPTLPAQVDPNAPTKRPRSVPGGLQTRLVSCGDSTAAAVAGDDTEGVIALGPGAGGACSLVFSRRWKPVPTCDVSGGVVASVTEHELVITGAGAAVAYRCQP